MPSGHHVGDINLAEPNALIGFAGARVSAGTIAQELPPGFQRSEFLFEHGFVDRVVHRSQLRAEIAALLPFLEPPDADATNGSEPAMLPSFRPLSFLSALADKMIPDVDGDQNGRPAQPAERPPSREPTLALPPRSDAARGKDQGDG